MTDSILIVGGGIAGLHVALQCARGGACAVVVERRPIVGGRLAATMTAPGAIGERAEGVRTPLFETLAADERIEIITLAELEGLDGRPGNFTATIRERARFVTDACTRCGLCRAVCPVVIPNEYDAGLTYRKAIYSPMAETLPGAWVIDTETCLNTPPNYLPCNRCAEACKDDAIHFDMALDKVHERQIGAVVLAPGFRVEDGERYADLGYGSHPDIVTSAELQRLLESPGPTGGYATRPSNEEYPESVLLVVDNLSRFALYIAASQVRQLLGQDVETVAVLVLSPLPSNGGAAEMQELAGETGVRVRWGAGFRAEPTADDRLSVSFEDFSLKRFARETWDMVVLCADVEPPEGLAKLADTVGVDLSDDGYIAVPAAEASSGTNEAIVATSRSGVFVAGCASGASNIKQSIGAAQAAADAALEQLDPRLLEPAAAARPAAERSESPAPDALRAQLEKLLYTLASRPDS